MRKVQIFVLALLAVLSLGVRADVVLLVHGYLGNAGSWEFSGVNAALAHNGWQPAGIIIPRNGTMLLPPSAPAAAKKAYTVELPSTAPLMVQSDMVLDALRALKARHGKEPITLVGHSAGGVVARLALVRDQSSGVTRLITIASPHLGTERALEALDATHQGGPIGFVKDVFGGRDYYTVKDSWPVLVDLSPSMPGSMLYWLNGQPHPGIEYVSIVRSAPFGLGDILVPGFSQDLNNVPPLAGKAKVYVTPAAHALVPADGAMLASLLK